MMRKCNSIVEKVNCRSFTALDLGLDVHRHSGLTILLCWNTHNITGCYRKYIVRETSELVVTMQMWCLFQRGACRCCFTYIWRLGKKHGKPCIYMDGYEWEKHSLSNMELRVGFSRIYMPVSGSFFFGIYRNDIYDCILFEEFDDECYKTNFWQIKRAIERKAFGVDCKNEVSRMLTVERKDPVHLLVTNSRSVLLRCPLVCRLRQWASPFSNVTNILLALYVQVRKWSARVMSHARSWLSLRVKVHRLKIIPVFDLYCGRILEYANLVTLPRKTNAQIGSITMLTHISRFLLLK